MPSIRDPLSTRSSFSMGAPVTLAAYTVLGPTIHPAVALGAPLRADFLLLVCLSLLMPWRSSGEGRSLRRRGWVFPVVMGGLFGAAVVSPLVALPWLLLPALWLAWAWAVPRVRRLEASRWRRGILLAVAAASINGAGVAVATAQGLRLSPEAFVQEDFRVNRLLDDIPVHDAWAIDLPGPASPTLENLAHAYRKNPKLGLTPAVIGLGIVRGVVGGILGWDRPCWQDPSRSFVARLTESDREGSSTRSGTDLGIWRILYALPREGLVELQNATVHVAVAGAVRDGPEGARLFLAFLVREVNWTTPPYLRLIDPARRFFIYPFLLRQLAHTWQRQAEGWESQTQRGE